MIARSVAVPLCALLFFASTADPQDKNKGGYSSNYQKAMNYIKENYPKVGYSYVPTLFAGFAFLMDGRAEYRPDFDKCVQVALRGYKNEKAFNGNWFLAWGSFFLATVYLHEPRPEIRDALVDALAVAERNIESTGGWCHHKGFAAESGYDKKGGATDLGILTTTFLSAMHLMKVGGIDVPKSLIERATKNLESIKTGAGFSYGTRNRHPDYAMSRGSMALIGWTVAKQTSHDLYTPAAEALPKAFKDTERAHSFGPLHFFACSVASQLLGKYSDYASHWLPELASRQKEDGTLIMWADGTGKKDGEARFTQGNRVASSSVFAIMISLQKGGLYPSKKSSSTAGGGGGPSPFSKKPGDKKPGDEPAPMIKPYVPEEFEELNKPPAGPLTGGGTEE
jgi:hypothetical protein